MARVGIIYTFTDRKGRVHYQPEGPYRWPPGTRGYFETSTGGPRPRECHPLESQHMISLSEPFKASVFLLDKMDTHGTYKTNDICIVELLVQVCVPWPFQKCGLSELGSSSGMFHGCLQVA